jgi:hypothetical protein
MHIETVQSFLKFQPATAGVIVTAGILAILLAVSFLIHVRLGRRLHRALQIINKNDSALASLSAEFQAQALLNRQISADLDELRKRLIEKEEAPATPYPVWGGESAINLNRRGQILKLARKGKSISEIAYDLNTSQGEVELLLKVHDLAQKTLEQKT